MKEGQTKTRVFRFLKTSKGEGRFEDGGWSRDRGGTREGGGKRRERCKMRERGKKKDGTNRDRQGGQGQGETAVKP